jgi:hypothetical protein
MVPILVKNLISEAGSEGLFLERKHNDRHAKKISHNGMDAREMPRVLSEQNDVLP